MRSLDRGGMRGKGDRGEDIASATLETAGYRILERGWTCRAGEIDLIVLDPDGTLAFVEVKTAYGEGAGDPGDWVGPTKRRRLSRTAMAWLSANDALDRAARFDLFIIRSDGSFEHLVDAFPVVET